MPAWISVSDALPPEDIPVMLWGSKLIRKVDFPLTGRLCGCHGVWVLDTQDPNEEGDGEYVERMLGTVTHWLNWRPGPSGVPSL